MTSFHHTNKTCLRKYYNICIFPNFFTTKFHRIQIACPNSSVDGGSQVPIATSFNMANHDLLCSKSSTQWQVFMLNLSNRHPEVFQSFSHLKTACLHNQKELQASEPNPIMILICSPHIAAYIQSKKKKTNKATLICRTRKKRIIFRKTGTFLGYPSHPSSRTCNDVCRKGQKNMKVKILKHWVWKKLKLGLSSPFCRKIHVNPNAACSNLI